MSEETMTPGLDEQSRRPDADAALVELAKGSGGQAANQCPICGTSAKSVAGLASHMRTHADLSGTTSANTSTVPPPSGTVTRGRPRKRSEMDEARDWIEKTLNPQLLWLGTISGIPREYLASPAQDPETGALSWPGQPTPVGGALQLDATAVNVYAATYVYGKDTWIYEYITKYGKQMLPFALCAGCAIVTLQQVAKFTQIRKMVLEQVAVQAKMMTDAAAQQAENAA